jgi:hypothetical protein
MSRYLLDRIERSPRIEVMTETERVAVHGTATVESVDLRDGRTGAIAQVSATAVFVWHPPPQRDAQHDASMPPATYCAVAEQRAATGICRGRSRTASLISWRRSGRECSPPVTCAPERQTGWRGRSATGPSPYGLRTTCWRASSPRTTCPARDRAGGDGRG